jgi:beta-lactamase superfamily II metal-dependent hydrolase
VGKMANYPSCLSSRIPNLMCKAEARDRTASPLAADLFMVPHHGSSGSLNQSIAARLLKPGKSVAVLEPLARHRLPHSEVLDLLDAMNAEVVSSEDHPLHFVLFQDGLYVRHT